MAAIAAVKNKKLESVSGFIYDPDIRTDPDIRRYSLQEFVNVAHDATIGGSYPIDLIQANGDVQSLVHSLAETADYADLVKNEEGFLHRRYGKMRYEDV